MQASLPDNARAWMELRPACGPDPDKLPPLVAVVPGFGEFMGWAEGLR